LFNRTGIWLAEDEMKFIKNLSCIDIKCLWRYPRTIKPGQILGYLFLNEAQREICTENSNDNDDFDERIRRAAQLYTQRVTAQTQANETAEQASPSPKL